MYRLTFAMLLLVAPGLAAAQVRDSTAADTIFLRAQRLVSEGQGAAGRALVQAQLDAAPADSPRFVEALYWRAVVGANVADVERDLRRIIVDYPLSSRSEDALIRLAQLEMSRGDRAQALAHLERLTLERPASLNRARADYWMARVLFETGELPKACGRLADATRTAPPDSVELRNQVEYATERCAGVDVTTSTATASTEATPVPRAPAPVTSAAASRPVHAGAPVTTPPTSPPERPVATPKTSSAPEPKTPAPVTRAPSTPAHSAHPAAVEYTVQVAAYNNKGQAQSLAKALVARGYQARVSPSGGTWRVRIGRYATRKAASDAAAHLKAKQMSAFVTEAEPK